ncbi:MAG TPA: hypothetical protein VK324_15625 [Tepidisphaeraceae bacterium]|nr:hypothetical protein [Tepidisphaeraceae bacterium]
MAALALPGCAVVGAVAHKVVGPPTQAARYKPRPGDPMLVLVENGSNPSANLIDAQRLSARLADELGRRQVVPIVPPEKLDAQRDRDLGGFPNRSVAGVGRSVGAKQVLYVNLHTFGIETAGPTGRGRAEARVKIVDAETGETRWPTDQADGYIVADQTPTTQLDQSHTVQALQDNLYQRMSDQIARLFFDYKPED